MFRVHVLLFAAGCTVDGPTRSAPPSPEEAPDIRTSWFATDSGPVELTYEMIDGRPIFQGDIVLPMPGRSTTVSAFGSRWPNGIVRVEDAGLYNDSRVRSAVTHLEWSTSIRFQFGATSGDRIQFRSVASGCSSSVGKIGGRQYINLSPGCTSNTVIHEIGHAIGLYHEQSRPDRDDYIDIHWDCIETGKSHNFDLVPTAIAVGPYDLDSLMHYGSQDFLDWTKTEGGQPCQSTITTTDGDPFIAAPWLSPGDLSGIESLYWMYGLRHPPLDYTGDGYTDATLFRPTTGQWWIGESDSLFTTSAVRSWGAAGDVPVPGDYDGDGVVDLAFYRPATGEWWVDQSTDGARVITFVDSELVPVPADYDGDGRTDFAVYRHDEPESFWEIVPSAYPEWGMMALWGEPGQHPAPADYTGDGLADLGAYNPNDGIFWVNNGHQTSGLYFDLDAGIPVPADYDADGRADLAVYDPYTGYWDVRSYDIATGANHVITQAYWGGPSSVPVPGNYVGGPELELGTFDTSSLTWSIADLSGVSLGSAPWGAAGDTPVQ